MAECDKIKLTCDESKLIVTGFESLRRVLRKRCWKGKEEKAEKSTFQTENVD